MPIENISQPEIINICTELRIRKFDHEYSFALDWYQDKDTVILADGLEAEQFIPIGDVTFSKEDMPIVIGDKRYRGKEIGRKVLEALIKRAGELGYKNINVREIYTYNIASQKLFESVGFKRSGNTEKGVSYMLIM